MEPGGLEMSAGLGKRRGRRRGQRKSALLKHSIDVVGPETNAFHVERRNRSSQGLTLVEELCARVTRWELLDERGQFPDPVLCGLPRVSCSAHGRDRNVPELDMTIND